MLRILKVEKEGVPLVDHDCFVLWRETHTNLILVNLEQWSSERTVLVTITYGGY